MLLVIPKSLLKLFSIPQRRQLLIKLYFCIVFNEVLENLLIHQSVLLHILFPSYFVAFFQNLTLHADGQADIILLS